MSDAPGQLSARLNTTKGTIVLRFFPEQAPEAVANFVELAEGTRQWRHPGTGQTTNERLYDGTIFHRIISGFMIQGGDPLGKGTGGPGYKFKNEVDPSLRFDRPYMLGMANSGPDTNGCQFFITVSPQPHLTGGYTLFGEVAEGTDVVDTIAAVPTDHSDRPREDVVLESVVIERG